MSVSFARDIAPKFSDFQANMNWRLDLTDYESVKINAATIYNLIETKQMPPPNYPALSPELISNFKEWMDSGYPQ